MYISIATLHLQHSIDLNHQISLQIFAQSALWYIKSHAISWLTHRLPHGELQEVFAKIWELTLSWLNQRRKANSSTTWWTRALLTDSGSGWSGKLMTTSFIGLMAALHIVLTSLILTGTRTNLIIMETKRTVGRFLSVSRNGMTYLALLRHILFSARSQVFPIQKGKMAGAYYQWGKGELRQGVRTSPFECPVCCPGSRIPKLTLLVSRKKNWTWKTAFFGNNLEINIDQIKAPLNNNFNLN